MQIMTKRKGFQGRGRERTSTVFWSWSGGAVRRTVPIPVPDQVKKGVHHFEHVGATEDSSSADLATYQAFLPRRLFQLASRVWCRMACSRTFQNKSKVGEETLMSTATF